MNVLETVAIAHAVVTALGLKDPQGAAGDVSSAIASLQAEAELYRRGYEAIGACDISNFLALCAIAGRIGEPVLHDTAVRMEVEREYRENNK